MFHERTKNVDVRFHFIKDVTSSGKIKLKKVSTEDNVVDMATKIVPLNKFRHCLDLI